MRSTAAKSVRSAYRSRLSASFFLLAGLCAVLAGAHPPLHAEEPGGVSKELPLAVADLAKQIAERYEPLKTGTLDRLALMDFDEIGEEVKKRSLGRVVTEYLGAKLVNEHGIKLVERSRLEELKKEITLSSTKEFDPETAQKIGGFLGAQALILGSVSEAGADFVITARLVSVKTGEVLLAADQIIRREGLIALAEDAVEKKSKSGAIFRSLIPGWGQFYNGPEHYGKGWAISVTCLLSGAGIVTLFVLAAQTQNEKAKYDTGSDAYLADLGQCISQGGSDEACRDQTDRTYKKKQDDLNSKANLYRYSGYGAVGLFGVFYLWGIIDAAVYGKDYDRIRVTGSPIWVPNRSMEPTGGMVQVTLPW